MPASQRSQSESTRSQQKGNSALTPINSVTHLVESSSTVAPEDLQWRQTHSPMAILSKERSPTNEQSDYFKTDTRNAQQQTFQQSAVIEHLKNDNIALRQSLEQQEKLNRTLQKESRETTTKGNKAGDALNHIKNISEEFDRRLQIHSQSAPSSRTLKIIEKVQSEYAEAIQHLLRENQKLEYSLKMEKEKSIVLKKVFFIFFFSIYSTTVSLLSHVVISKILRGNI